MHCETVIQSIEAENTDTNSLTFLNKAGKAGKSARGIQLVQMEPH